MTEEEYYATMTKDLQKNPSFESLLHSWYRCFHYILKNFNVAFSDLAIKSLFFDFHMENWKALHLEGSEYQGLSQKELLDDFFGECLYISDRTSYDRLFRTHWLVRQAFREELHQVSANDFYPSN